MKCGQLSAVLMATDVIVTRCCTLLCTKNELSLAVREVAGHCQVYILESCMGIGMTVLPRFTAVMGLDFMTVTAVIAGLGTAFTVIPR